MRIDNIGEPVPGTLGETARSKQPEPIFLNRTNPDDKQTWLGGKCLIWSEFGSFLADVCRLNSILLLDFRRFGVGLGRWGTILINFELYF